MDNNLSSIQYHIRQVQILDSVHERWIRQFVLIKQIYRSLVKEGPLRNIGPPPPLWAQFSAKV